MDIISFTIQKATIKFIGRIYKLKNKKCGLNTFWLWGVYMLYNKNGNLFKNISRILLTCDAEVFNSELKNKSNKCWIIFKKTHFQAFLMFDGNIFIIFSCIYEFWMHIVCILVLFIIYLKSLNIIVFSS